MGTVGTNCLTVTIFTIETGIIPPPPPPQHHGRELHKKCIEQQRRGYRDNAPTASALPNSTTATTFATSSTGSDATSKLR